LRHADSHAGSPAAGARNSLPSLLTALASGAVIGVLGGLIGLGGAEFRLPLLLAVFGFVALEAVILNKAISLIVVVSALGFRSTAVPFADVLAQWPVLMNLLAGSLAGAWFGADFATRISARALHGIIAMLLIAIALVLALAHDPVLPASPIAQGTLLIAIGVVSGLIIGAIASLLGVAGGEFLIPTLVLLFGIDIKLAGSLSLAISLPTMLVGLARYSRDQSFAVVRSNSGFAIVMVAGSIAGAYFGTRLLTIVAATVIVPILVAILVVSAIKIWRHR
jgi:uncharacterized membrane protein YfcA